MHPIAPPLKVHLEAGYNPDFGHYSHTHTRPPKLYLDVPNLRQARLACLQYRDAWQLGGGHWAGGQVHDATGREVARISYNGRIWEPGEFPTSEITRDIDGKPLTAGAE